MIVPFLDLNWSAQRAAVARHTAGDRAPVRIGNSAATEGAEIGRMS
jgi:hypothetical protein